MKVLFSDLIFVAQGGFYKILLFWFVQDILALHPTAIKSPLPNGRYDGRFTRRLESQYLFLGSRLGCGLLLTGGLLLGSYLRFGGSLFLGSCLRLGGSLLLGCSILLGCLNIRG